MDLPDLTAVQYGYFGTLMEKCAANAEITIQQYLQKYAVDPPLPGTPGSAEWNTEGADAIQKAETAKLQFQRRNEDAGIAHSEHRDLAGRLEGAGIGAAGGAGAGLLTNYLLGAHHPVAAALGGAGIGAGAGAYFSPEMLGALVKALSATQGGIANFQANRRGNAAAKAHNAEGIKGYNEKLENNPTAQKAEADAIKTQKGQDEMAKGDRSGKKSE